MVHPTIEYNSLHESYMAKEYNSPHFFGSHITLCKLSPHDVFMLHPVTPVPRGPTAALSAAGAATLGHPAATGPRGHDLAKQNDQHVVGWGCNVRYDRMI